MIVLLSCFCMHCDRDRSSGIDSMAKVSAAMHALFDLLLIALQSSIPSPAFSRWPMLAPTQMDLSKSKASYYCLHYYSVSASLSVP